MAQPNDLQHEMERYLSHFARHGKRPTIVFTHSPATSAVWTPLVDVYETAESVVVRLDLAGVDPTRTEIHAEPGRLLVRGVRDEQPSEPREQRRVYHTLEIPQGRFERVLSLPVGADVSAASAAYRDGILEITLPKRSSQPVRISVGRGGEESA